MKIARLFLIYSASVSFLSASGSNKRDFDEAIPLPRKRDRRASYHEDIALVEGMGNINLSSGTAESEDADEFILHLDSIIPSMTDMEVFEMIEEAICNDNISLFKLLHKHDRLAFSVENNHIDALIRIDTPASTSILRFIFSNTPQNYNYYRLDFMRKLSYAIARGNFEKFQIIWEALNAETIDIFFLSELAAKAAYPKHELIYEYILEKISATENALPKLEILKKKAFNYCILHNNIGPIEFILERGDASVSDLNIEQKVKILRMAVSNNRVRLVRELLSLPDLLERVKFVTRSPMMDAVSNDFPEILDAFLDFITHYSINSIAVFAFSSKSFKVLEYLKTKLGNLSPSLLFSMASTAIANHDPEAFENSVKLGLDLSRRNSDGENLLTMAVASNDLMIAEYLLSVLKFHPDTPNINSNHPDSRIISAPIHSAKSMEMISLLAVHNVDLNAKLTIETHQGVIFQSITALNHAALTKRYNLVYGLIDAGADDSEPHL